MKYDFELNLDTDNSLSLIIRQLKPDATVLEFGPAYGRLTKYMKEEMSCRVYVVEIDWHAGRKAAQYSDDIVIGDIESYLWYDRYKDISFDYIIFADVLEHLKNPQKALKKSAELLAENGRILLSVPNLAHNSVIIDLLNDKFNYNSIGLLDDTHIHFFTQTSLEAMIEECGLAAVKKMATYAPVGTIEIHNSVNDVRGIGAGFWNTRKHGEVYQYVYELMKKDNDVIRTADVINDVINDVIDDTMLHYSFQIYYSGSEEYNEDDSRRYPADVGGGTAEYRIPVEHGWRNVRIDPIDASCIMRVNGAYAKCGVENVPLDEYWDNALCKNNGYWYFTSSDPGIAYRVPDGAEEIVFSYTVEAVDFGADSDCVRNLTEFVEELKSSNILIDNKYRQEMERANLMQSSYEQEKIRADALQEWADNLRRKKLYRLYKFFRRK